MQICKYANFGCFILISISQWEQGCNGYFTKMPTLFPVEIVQFENGSIVHFTDFVIFAQSAVFFGGFFIDFSQKFCILNSVVRFHAKMQTHERSVNLRAKMQVHENF